MHNNPRARHAAPRPSLQPPPSPPFPSLATSFAPIPSLQPPPSRPHPSLGCCCPEIPAVPQERDVQHPFPLLAIPPLHPQLSLSAAPACQPCPGSETCSWSSCPGIPAVAPRARHAAGHPAPAYQRCPKSETCSWSSCPGHAPMWMRWEVSLLAAIKWYRAARTESTCGDRCGDRCGASVGQVRGSCGQRQRT
eukprot:365781-Chlamydomonas_euryale.AAC.2